MKKILFTALFMLCMAPFTAICEDEKPADEPLDKTSTEWFGFAAGGGLYGGGGALQAFTPRWESLYWQIIEADFYYGGPKQSGGFGDGDTGRRWQVGASSIVGYPMFFDDSLKQELRFGGGLGFHFMSGGGGVLPCFHLFESDEKCQAPPQFIGLNATLEVKYVYHISKHFAFQAGAELFLALWPYRDEDENLTYVTPSVVGNVGLRF